MTEPSQDTEQELKRMRWAARRGMLELDLVLEPFVNGRFAALSQPDQACFRRLMECEDQELFGWFMGRERPDDAELAAMVDQILEYARRPPAG